MIFRLSLGIAALLPIASCTPPAPGAGSLMSAAAPATAPEGMPTKFGLAAGWFARQAGYQAVASLTPAGQGLTQPFVQSGGATPFVNSSRTVEDAERSLECLTAAVYYEARSEPVEGQRAS
jgi:spore germination cell wall hydrolase CwlJ-like protein